MQEEHNNYFKSALSDFAFDVACGAQIRHLADLGYTVSQMMGELDISMPYGVVQKTVTEYFCKTGVLISKKPGSELSHKTEFVREYDSYGRPSFRQVVVKEVDTAEIHWKDYSYKPVFRENLLSFLNRKIEENGEEFSYISCDFGCTSLETAKYMEVLDRRQREYIEGILWEKSRMYHRITPQIREIISRLYECGLYEGECYFKKTREHIIL